MPEFRRKLVYKDSFSLSRSCTEAHIGLGLCAISTVANVPFAKRESLLDEEVDLEEHKTHLAFVVIGTVILALSDQFKIRQGPGPWRS